jgi:hypothetical protein
MDQAVRDGIEKIVAAARFCKAKLQLTLTFRQSAVFKGVVVREAGLARFVVQIVCIAG